MTSRWVLVASFIPVLIHGIPTKQTTLERGSTEIMCNSTCADTEHEYPAQVVFAPPIQYIVLGHSGIIHCHVRANPPIEFINWVKNRRLLEPNNNTIVMTNGSLFISNVDKSHAGNYSCTPYNNQGTQGSSKNIEVFVVDTKPEETGTNFPTKSTTSEKTSTGCSTTCGISGEPQSTSPHCAGR